MCQNHTHAQPTAEIPMFEHDCNTCVYLGRYEGPNYGKVDLYAHLTGLPTMIARWSNDGPHYASGLEFSYGAIEELTEARTRAEAAGLMEYNVYRALDYARKGTEAYDQMLKALPFTKEYQAVLAFRAGDTDRSQGLLQHLTQLTLAKLSTYREEPTQREALCEVERQIARILEVREGLTLEAWGVSAAMTEFLWAPEVAALSAE